MRRLCSRMATIEPRGPQRWASRFDYCNSAVGIRGSRSACSGCRRQTTGRRATRLRQAIAEWADGGHGPVVLVLDQFEEFLLYHPNPIATPFVQQLSEVTSPTNGSDAHVLFSLREDSLAPLDQLRAVVPGILSSPIQLLPLDEVAARQAILKPVVEWSERNLGRTDGVVAEEALVAELLRQVRISAGGSVGLSSSACQSLVELPLLQLTLERLWLEEAEGGNGACPA